MDTPGQDGVAVPSVARKKRVKVKRPRGKRGGIKHHRRSQAGLEAAAASASKKSKKSKGQEAAGATGEKAAKAAEHARAIALFHTLEKQLAQTSSPSERARIEAEQKALGGLQAYQDASLVGADKLRGGETGKWCAEQLLQVLEPSGTDTRPSVKLLDVGALQGTAYAKYPWVKTTSIDVNPRSESVLRCDFFDLPVPAQDEDRFDVVALSLVINFVGDIAARGQMLRHALRYLRSDGARLLYLVLPRACVSNSRYCTHDHLRNLLCSTGWDKVVKQDDSARLTRWLVQATSKRAKWDGKVWKKKELKVGVKLNNFCIVVK